MDTTPVSAARKGRLLGLLDQAVALLREAGSVPLGGDIADAELVQAVQRLEAVARVAQGHKLGLVAEIASREAHRGHAAASTEDLLARTLRLSSGEARAQTELAKGLVGLPGTAAALADGRIGIGQAAVAVKKAAELAGRDDAPELVAKVDEAAASTGQQVDRNRLARELDTVIAKAGVDVLSEREATAHRRRSLSVTTRDGMTVIHAELDPVGGAHVRAALDSFSRPDGEGDKRSFPQRQADALVTLASMALEAPEEIKTRGGVAQQVILITSADALHDTEGAEPSLLDGHGPVSPALARQLCCGADARRVDTDRNGKILDVGRNHRVATDAQRAAVIARDKGCIGCQAPVSRCQVHHIKWWRHKGKTDEDNLALVCWTCHTHIHHHGWQVFTDQDGRYRTGLPEPATPHLDNSREKPGLRRTG